MSSQFHNPRMMVGFVISEAEMADWRPGDSCAIKGCSDPIRSVGFCARHYIAWNLYGHPLAGELIDHRARVRRTRDKERKAYHAMKTRCTNKRVRSWPEYGGRGICICDRWLESFENFYADMGPAPDGYSLDRVDHNGNYEPGNCRWADATTQNRNQRRVKLTERLVAEAKGRHASGESVASIARDFGILYFTVYQAIVGTSWKEVESIIK